MNLKTHPRLPVLLLVFLALTWPPDAGAADFEKKLDAVDELLLAGDGTLAYQKADRLFGQIPRNTPDDKAARWLSRLTVQRALSAYQSGRMDEAIWHWRVVNQLDPTTLDLDLAEYGEAGAFLREHTTPEEMPPPQTFKKSELVDASGRFVLPPGMKHVETLTKVQPKIGRVGGQGFVAVNLIVGLDGRPREPRFVKLEGKTSLHYIAADALRQWTFQPAERDGEPYEVTHSVVLNMSTRQ